MALQHPIYIQHSVAPRRYRECILEQDAIGWKTLLEGVPSKKWKIIQESHYQSIGSKHNAKGWILALVKLLINMAWDQWEHRNDILHRVDKPRQQRALQLLHQNILSQLAEGCQSLSRQDRRYFSFSYNTLISKPLEYKKAWIGNVHAARQAAALRANEANAQRLNFFLPRTGTRQLVPPTAPTADQPTAPANNDSTNNVPPAVNDGNTGTTNRNTVNHTTHNSNANRAAPRRRPNQRRNNPAPEMDSTLLHWMKTGRLR